MSEGTDWAWCYENPKEAASLIDALEADRNAYKAQANLFKHMVITCGVAATHSDANLTRTGSYAEKWNSQQAEQVRTLRAERDALRKDAERYRWLRECGPEYSQLEIFDYRGQIIPCELDIAIDAGIAAKEPDRE